MKLGKNILMFLTLVIILLVGVLIWRYGQTSNISDNSKKKIATSIFPSYDITKNIVGDNFEVVQILPAGASPHTYEPTIQDKQKLQGVSIAFMVGLEVDDWMIDILPESSNLVYLYQDVDLLESDDEHGEEEHEYSGEYDPHYWLSINSAVLMAKNIYESVSEIDTENQEVYKKNYDEYVRELTESRQEYLAELDRLDSKKLVTFHSAFNYFAKDLDLEIVATVEPFPGKEPTPAYILSLEETLNENEVKVLFKEPQLPDSSLTPITEGKDIAIYTLDPLGGVEGRNSYLKLIEYNVNTIVNALD